MKKDLTTWEYSGPMIELIGRQHDLLADRNLAFPFMLSKETKKLHETKERINFFTNQITSELRRVGKDNGDALIEHFVAKAQIQVEYINQQKDMWVEFLDFFENYDSNTQFELDEEYDLIESDHIEENKNQEEEH
jgi:hypothetical protein